MPNRIRFFCIWLVRVSFLVMFRLLFLTCSGFFSPYIGWKSWLGSYEKGKTSLMKMNWIVICDLGSMKLNQNSTVSGTTSSQLRCSCFSFDDTDWKWCWWTQFYWSKWSKSICPATNVQPTHHHLLLQLIKIPQPHPVPSYNK